MNDMSVAQRIRQLIVSGELKPGGRVAEAAIAERLGVSRTPVRNVIPALATEGLLEPIGRRGYAVRRFSIEDSFRATELRCVLEGQAARTIAAKGAAGADGQQQRGSKAVDIGVLKSVPLDRKSVV